MQDGVLNAANILINRQPAAGLFQSKRLFVVMGIAVTEIVPRRAVKSIERVGFPPGFAAALGTSGFDKAFVPGQRVAAFAGELHIFRQFDREIFFWNRNNTAVIAINDRNRRPPVSLAGNQPITQAVV